MSNEASVGINLLVVDGSIRIELRDTTRGTSSAMQLHRTISSRGCLCESLSPTTILDSECRDRLEPVGCNSLALAHRGAEIIVSPATAFISTNQTWQNTAFGLGP